MKYLYYPHAWPSRDVSTITEFNCYTVEHDEIEEVDEWEFEMLAEKCAEDYHSNHDGWEHSTWPNNCMPFILYDDKMNLIGTFDVYLEYQPTFTASRQ